MSSSSSEKIRLTAKQKAVLYGAYVVLDKKMHLHVSIERIRKGMLGRTKYKIKKPLEALVAKSLLREKPTGGSMTYSPTLQGVEIAKDLFPELFKD